MDWLVLCASVALLLGAIYISMFLPALGIMFGALFVALLALALWNVARRAGVDGRR